MRISLKFLRAFLRGLMFLSPIWLTLCVLIFGMGVLVAELEGLRLQDGLYFAWVTALTVGYGDVVMVRTLSQVCALLIALTGIVFSGIWVAIAVQAVRAAFTPENDSEPHPFAGDKHGKAPRS